MKIVHISIIDPFTDGWSYQHNMLIKYHRRLGHDVSIIVPTRAWTHKGTVEVVEAGVSFNADGVKIIRLAPDKSMLPSRFARYNAFLSTVENESPDIVFIHGCQFLDVRSMVQFAKCHPEVRIYVDNHADPTNSATNFLSREILHKRIWRHCARTIAPYVKKFYGVLPVRVDFLKEMYLTPADKTELLVMGTDDDLANAAAKPEVRARIRAKYNIADDDCLLITGGKIDTFKKQTFLLMEAVRQIDDPKLKLLVFGSVEPELKEQLNSLCSDRIQYIGWVNADDSYEYFAAADLAVFPGRHSVFWEQVVGQGIPLVVKRWPGTEHVDLGGNTAFLDEDSVSAIREAILRIITNQNVYDGMKKIAEEKGREVFSYLNIAKRSIEE